MKNPNLDTKESSKTTLLLCALGAALGIAVALPATAISAAFSQSARHHPAPVSTSNTVAPHTIASEI